MPLSRGRKPRAFLDRFMDLVSPEPTSGCWLWMGAADPRGYGNILADGGRPRLSAHRASYEIFVRPIPEGYVVDHLCRVPCCVNPRHLEAVTQQINVARGIAVAKRISRANCPKGHPYSGINLRLRLAKDGKRWRQCVACLREASRVWIRRKRIKHQSIQGENNARSETDPE